jgi:hypothetical protein
METTGDVVDRFSVRDQKGAKNGGIGGMGWRAACPTPGTAICIDEGNQTIDGIQQQNRRVQIRGNEVTA